MSLVGRGLPDGPLVTAGLGQVDAAVDSGAMAATITGHGSVFATLGVVGSVPLGTGRSIGVAERKTRKTPHLVADLAATVAGSCNVSATLVAGRAANLSALSWCAPSASLHLFAWMRGGLSTSGSSSTQYRAVGTGDLSATVAGGSRVTATIDHTDLTWLVLETSTLLLLEVA